MNDATPCMLLITEGGIAWKADAQTLNALQGDDFTYVYGITETNMRTQQVILVSEF